MTKGPVILALAAMTCAVVPGSRRVLAATPAANDDQVRHIYYTIAFTTGTAELWAIEVTGGKVATTDIGPVNTGCAALAMSPSGKLMSMCGAGIFAPQQLTSIDTKTGMGTLFGVTVPGLAIMSMTFAPNGILYAVGDCNPNGPNFECGPGSPPDPDYNSLYTIDTATGTVTRVGSTGAPQYFMDLAFDRDGNLWGVTTCLNPCYIPAILYRIDIHTGAATKVANLIGSNQVMGLAFAPDGRLYATDWMQNPGLYLIDPKTGLERAVAAMPFGYSTALEFADQLP